VFTLEYYFSSKLFVALRESFSNAYPDKKVANKTPTCNKISGHGKCLSVTSAYPATKQLKLRPYRF
jgi:hypothetical protein